MRGLTVMAVSREFGIPYMTIYQHLKGKREVSPAAAIRYEISLGIPRSELRPDLWPPATTPESQAAAGDSGPQHCASSRAYGQPYRPKNTSVTRICPHCLKKYLPTSNRQIYCCVECREAARHGR